jgi:hypothetical protein
MLGEKKWAEKDGHPKAGKWQAVSRHTRGAHVSYLPVRILGRPTIC